MTAYNLLNGEWCGQSKYVITELLRNRLGFQWLVITDWWSVWDGKKIAASGQDLEMPYAVALKDARNLIKDGKVHGEYVDKLAYGGGSAEVDGYNTRLMLDELKKEFGGRLRYIKNPTVDQIKEIKMYEVVHVQAPLPGE